MNRAFIILFLIFQISFLNGQSLSKKEAIAFAEKLENINILSEKGRTELTKCIEENNFVRGKRVDLITGRRSTLTKLSVSHILFFLGEAFMYEYCFRSGMAKELGKYEKLNFDAYKKIEEKIEDEEKFSEKSTAYYYYHFKEYSPFKSIDLLAESIPDLISTQRSAMGKTCTRTLNDLLKIGLISEQVHQEVKLLIETNQISLENYVLLYAGERVAFYEDFKENKINESDFIKQLNESGSISDKNFEILSNNKESLFRKYDFLNYAEDAKIFQFKKYAVNPEIGYQEIFEDIKSLVPQFDFTNISTELVEKKVEWYDSFQNLTYKLHCKLNVQFDINGEKHSNSISLGYKNCGDLENDTILHINNKFVDVVNQYLADINSKQRLYFATKYPVLRADSDKPEFGLILLTKEQFNAWGDHMDIFIF